jgi:spore coat assembly protein SafA
MSHVVKKGENVFLICKEHKVALGDLLDANPQIDCPERIAAGQVFNIPGQAGYRQEPCSENTYVVQPGDTMYRIAHRYGVSLQALIAANPQISDPAAIYPGQTINLPAGAGAGAGAGAQPGAVNVSITVRGVDRVLVPQRTVSVSNFDLSPYLGNDNRWGPGVLTRPTVAHALIKALLDARINFEVEPESWGLYFSLINGLQAGDIRPTSGWLYTVNGNQPLVAPNAYLLQGGENIVWEFSLEGLH